MEIDLKAITPYQKLIISKGLCDYQYIMEHLKDNDSFFRKVYYDFYLSARWSVMSKSTNKDAYFNLLANYKLKNNSKEDLLDVLKKLQEKLEYRGNKALEFSIGSKLLHTINPQVPIYDSRVRKFLSKELDFQWQKSGRNNGSPEDCDKISHDWKVLCEWYKKTIESNKGEEWINWFNDNFPQYIKISNIKKIDFIIFAITD